jgi:hypothetical protein
MDINQPGLPEFGESEGNIIVPPFDIGGAGGGSTGNGDIGFVQGGAEIFTPDRENFPHHPQPGVDGAYKRPTLLTGGK